MDRKYWAQKFDATGIEEILEYSIEEIEETEDLDLRGLLVNLRQIMDGTYTYLYGPKYDTDV